MRVTKHLHFDLQLFSEGGTASGGTSASGGAGGASGASSQVAAVNTGDNSQSPAEDRAALYQKFRTDYKAEFDAEVQGIVKDRLKKARENENAAKQYREKAGQILAMVSDKYGVDPEDLDTLLGKVTEDNDYYENLALKNGTTPERERQLKQTERENAQLKARDEAQRKRAEYEDWVASMKQQEQELKGIYPDFDFIRESEENELFQKLVRNGVSMKNAYEVAHHDEIMAQGMQFAAKQAAAKTQASINANSQRPKENGLNSSSTADKKVDIKNMSLKELQAYGDLARLGKRITFKD
ncbi:MAG: hypothetical protein IKJ27_00205 [Clostridia bacterium]|nr:hypothetical protein [Clostridia bacterium]